MYETLWWKCDVDVLVSPTSPTTAFKFGENTDDPLKMYLADVLTIAANVAGICGINVPCGMDSKGLPIGMQILGPQLGEETILKTAHAYEQANEWYKAKPALIN